MQKLSYLLGLTAVLAGASVAMGAFTGFDDFDSYADQAAFQATWKPLFNDNSSMALIQAQDIGYSDSQCIAGAAPGNYKMRNYQYVDNFTKYKARAGAPMEFSVMAQVVGGTDGLDNIAARNFIEVRGYDEMAGLGGFVNPPPYPAGTAPNFGVATNLRMIALGTYNTPNSITGVGWYARVIGPGASAWVELNTARPAIDPTFETWTKLTAKVYTDKVEIYVNNVLDKTVTLTGPMAPMGAVILGSGLTSGTTNVDVMFDDVTMTPEPVTMLMLAAGGLFLRRRRGA